MTCNRCQRAYAVGQRSCPWCGQPLVPLGSRPVFMPDQKPGLQPGPGRDQGRAHDGGTIALALTVGAVVTLTVMLIGVVAVIVHRSQNEAAPSIAPRPFATAVAPLDPNPNSAHRGPSTTTRPTTTLVTPVDGAAATRSPEIVAGRVVTFSGSTAIGIDLATGAKVWSHELPCAQPGFADGLIQTNHDHALILCDQAISSLDPQTGAEVWHSPPICFDHQVSRQWLGCGLYPDGIQVFNVTDGSAAFQVRPGRGPESWVFAGNEVIVSTSATTSAPTPSPPSAVPPTTHLVDENTGPMKIAYDATGAERWRAELHGSVRGTDDGLFVATPTTVAEIDLGSGRQRWLRQSPNEAERIVDSTGEFAVVTDLGGNILTVDRQRGAQLWIYEPASREPNAPGLDGNGGLGRPAVVLGDGHIVAVAFSKATTPSRGLTILGAADGTLEYRDPSVSAPGVAIGAGSLAYTTALPSGAGVVIQRLR